MGFSGSLVYLVWNTQLVGYTNSHSYTLSSIHIRSGWVSLLMLQSSVTDLEVTDNEQLIGVRVKQRHGSWSDLMTLQEIKLHVFARVEVPGDSTFHYTHGLRTKTKNEVLRSCLLCFSALWHVATHLLPWRQQWFMWNRNHKLFCCQWMEMLPPAGSGCDFRYSKSSAHLYGLTVTLTHRRTAVKSIHWTLNSRTPPPIAVQQVHTYTLT